MTGWYARVNDKENKYMINEKFLLEIMEDLENPNIACFGTGFTDFDTIISLPEKKGALITIGARPAMGKTTLILTLLEKQMEKNKKALFFSLEMSEEQLIKRLLFQVAEVYYIKSHRKILNQKDWEKIAQALNKITKWDLTIDDTTGIDIEHLETAVREQKPDIVFIDYLQLLEGKRKLDRVSQVEEIMKNLKRIAKENGIVIFITSQLSRAVENRCDKRPMLSDLRESGAIENISDIVIFIYRDEYYTPREDDDIRPKGLAEIIVAKNKFGCCGALYLKFNPAIPKFHEYRSDLLNVF